jgi:L-ascorbate metabolism protein UlaG (beta-lactamase superfamily)
VQFGVEISWYGNGCFRLRSQLGTVITDPYPPTPALRLPKLKASIVAVSDPTLCDDTAVTREGSNLLLTGPGEYEVGGIFIVGVPMQSRGQPTVTAFVFEMEGLAVCHLGLPWQVPSAAQIENLGDIDVLLLPVGGPDRIGVQAVSDLASELEPKVLIPMYYSLPEVPDDRFHTLDRLAHEMGSKLPEPAATFNTRRKGGIGQNTLALLECRAQVRRESVTVK